MNFSPKDQRATQQARAEARSWAKKEAERKTGSRLRAEAEPPTQAEPLRFGDLGSGVIEFESGPSHRKRPEALTKPFASLPPPGELDAEFSEVTSHRGAQLLAPFNGSIPAPRISTQGAGDSSLRTGSLRPSMTPAGTSIRPKNTRTYCNRHKLAKSDRGTCMMCEREAGASSTGMSWQMPVMIMLCAVALGATLAAYL